MKRKLCFLIIASVNIVWAQDICKANKGEIVIATNGSNDDYKVCKFSESMYCSYKSLIRSNCPIGGVDVNKYKTPEEWFCVVHGGVVYKGDFEDMCYLPSGRYLPLKKYYAEKELYG